ncbi:MAG: ketopantoate reductase family protein [Acidimicrobiales bacterium]
MKFIVVGPGAIGGVIGGRLFESGHDVVLVARGRHLDAIRSQGLKVVSPGGTVTLPIPATGNAEDLDVEPGDVAIVATKSHDTLPALEGLVASRGADALAIACAQNGVRNEEAALRMFANVYGICVMSPTAHSEPGVVEAYSSPTEGILDIGRYPSGTDETAISIAEALSGSRFVSVPRPDIMRWKYRKLIMNLYNALDALLGERPWPDELTSAITNEATAVLDAAGIDVATPEEDRERRGDLLKIAPTEGGTRRGGGSSWQSLDRGLGSIETDYLNGEIVLLGRLHGVPTPVNATVQRLAGEAARSRATPGSYDASDLLAMLG